MNLFCQILGSFVTGMFVGLLRLLWRSDRVSRHPSVAREVPQFADFPLAHFPLNRYKPEPFLQQLNSASKHFVNEDKFIVPVELDDHRSELYAATSDFGDFATAISAMAEALQQITFMDNLVQRSCQREWEQSNVTPDCYMLHIAWIEVKPQRVTLGYWGSHVNTEWNAVFEKQSDGSWAAVNF